MSKLCTVCLAPSKSSINVDSFSSRGKIIWLRKSIIPQPLTPPSTICRLLFAFLSSIHLLAFSVLAKFKTNLIFFFFFRASLIFLPQWLENFSLDFCYSRMLPRHSLYKSVCLLAYMLEISVIKSLRESCWAVRRCESFPLILLECGRLFCSPHSCPFSAGWVSLLLSHCLLFLFHDLISVL